MVMLMAMATASVNAQNPMQQKFSPERFQAELEQYVTKEACLTPQEAAKFFPVYKEMQGKQRAIFEQQRQLNRVKPTDEKGCEKAIRQRDEFDLELKRIQQTYHNKFLSIISASKLYDVLKAEDHFHRQMLKGWGHNGRDRGGKKEKSRSGQ
ncbi:MAG: hypothetical protein IJ533_00845 [Prevotella sp.]|nr:hypothetical protein [Prevotella sp.]